MQIEVKTEEFGGSMTLVLRFTPGTNQNAKGSRAQMLGVQVRTRRKAGRPRADFVLIRLGSKPFLGGRHYLLDIIGKEKVYGNA